MSQIGIHLSQRVHFSIVRAGSKIVLSIHAPVDRIEYLDPEAIAMNPNFPYVMLPNREKLSIILQTIMGSREPSFVSFIAMLRCFSSNLEVIVTEWSDVVNISRRRVSISSCSVTGSNGRDSGEMLTICRRGL